MLAFLNIVMEAVHCPLFAMVAPEWGCPSQPPRAYSSGRGGYALSWHLRSGLPVMLPIPAAAGQPPRCYMGVLAKPGPLPEQCLPPHALLGHDLAPADPWKCLTIRWDAGSPACLPARLSPWEVRCPLAPPPGCTAAQQAACLDVACRYGCIQWPDRATRLSDSCRSAHSCSGPTCGVCRSSGMRAESRASRGRQSLAVCCQHCLSCLTSAGVPIACKMCQRTSLAWDLPQHTR